MNWNAEANSKLLVGILQVFDLKFNKEILDKLNYYMGPECSGQSITSQISKLKKSLGGAKLASMPSTPRTPKTPRTTKGGKRKRVDGTLSDDMETPVKKRGSKTPKLERIEIKSDGEDGNALGTILKQERSFFDCEEDEVGFGVDAV
ncbi:putative at hook motif protein [Neofusicoccum parvum UCRNP2]|uniref:Putative at hook motif protein n=1 Tax=Botryosphaeria parva (strain UCR-NP2) TaxID=1287680 RepID=R1EFY4_BOTPV|nr:putative at hook motif protein [Neofusicoccum parvum UCRNP2]